MNKESFWIIASLWACLYVGDSMGQVIPTLLVAVVVLITVLVAFEPK